MSDAAVPRWSRAQLTAFRFAFAIVVLSIPRVSIFFPRYLLFDAARRPIAALLNSWDQFEWRLTTSFGLFILRIVQGGDVPVRDALAKLQADRVRSVLPDMLGVLTIALLLTGAWSALDRPRTEYGTLYRWMRLYLRYAIGTVMLTYAFVKVIPTQFGFLTPGELMLPLGQLSPFRLLWDFMATSPGYTMFTGLIELFGAVLLFFRRTTLLGALILAAALTNVLAMDIAYGVGAVYYATMLFLLDVILVAHYVPSLGRVMILGGSGPVAAEPPPRREGWYSSVPIKIALIAFLAFPLVRVNLERRQAFGETGHSVVGLFDVAQFVHDRQSGGPTAAESVAWMRVASGYRTGFSRTLSVQLSTGEVHEYDLSDDADGRVWSLRCANPAQTATLRYAIRADGGLSLSGQIGEDRVSMVLRPIDAKKFFPLLKQE